MKKIDLGQTLHLLGNVGVIIGILLLVYELNQNRDLMRAQTRNDISQQISGRLSNLGGDAQVASVKRRAEAGEELTEDEEHQYYLMFVANMRDWENIHYQYRHGLFDEVEFGAERTAWRFLNNRNKAFSRNWCLTRRNYSPEFVAEMEGTMPENFCQTSQSE